MRRAVGKLRRGAAGLDRHVLALGLVLAAIGLFLAYISAASVNGVPFRDGYSFTAALPSETPPLKPSDAVRVGGQRVGSVQDVRLTPDGGIVEIELDSDAPVGRDAQLFIRLRSASYLYYVDLDPGDREGDPLEEGGTLPAEQVDTGTDPLEIARAFGEDTQQAFKTSVTALGFGIAGRGRGLNEGIGDLEPALRQGTPQLAALTRTPRALETLITGAQQALRGLAGDRSADLERTIAAARPTLETVAGRSTELGRTIEAMPPLAEQTLATLPLADPLFDDAAALAGDLAPTFRDLEAALPEVNRLLETGDTLRSEAELLTAALDPALEQAAPVLRALYPPAASLEPLIAELRPIAVYLSQYGRDVRVAGEGLVAITEQRDVPGPQPAVPVLRFAPIFTCHTDRDPYPEPGEALGQRSTKGPTECLR